MKNRERETLYTQNLKKKEDELEQMRASDEGMPESPYQQVDLRKAYEQYTGICDVYEPEEAIAMAAKLREARKNPNRKIMIGVMTHPIVLNQEMEDPYETRKEFPTTEQMAKGFTDDPDVLNTIHYADLYGPNAGRNLLENLKLCVEHGGEHLDAIQLDLTWPNPDEIKKFKEENPSIFIILQVGKFAIKETEGDPQEIVDKLRKYDDSVDFVLLDLSMGMGKGMEANKLLPLLRVIKKDLPYLGLAVAGGLGPDSANSLRFVAEEFPEVSIDAQGNLKRSDAPRDPLGHLIATYPADLNRTEEYIEKTCAVLDNPKK